MRFLTFMARRFVAGDTVSDAMKAVAALNKHHILATIDHLGENIHTKEEATAAADAYLEIFDAIEKSGVESNASIKLTMMGLEIDPEFCFENVQRLLDRAGKMRNFVRIDMEGSGVTESTIQLFYRLREIHPHVGIVIQAYLRRSEADVRRAAEAGANVRLCKGTYKEPSEIAFPTKEEVNESYLKLAKILLDGKGHVALATHDPKMIEPLKEYIREKNIPRERYEWQMLYGIAREMQRQIAASGDTMRVYVPYGTDWFGYFSRRMIERKENTFFVLKHFLRG